MPNDASVERERIKELNGEPEVRGDYVLYWMQQSQRAGQNPALEIAVTAANRLNLPVLVCFGLTENVFAANTRHYTFMLEGLAETQQQLRKRGIGFVIRRGSPHHIASQLAHRAALVVCDHGYLTRQKTWRAHVAAHAGRRVISVEADVVVPVELASSKAEVGARTLRSKLQPYRQRFLVRLREQRPRVAAERLRLGSDVDLTDVPALVARLPINHSVRVAPEFRGGISAARRRLRTFISEDLSGYDAERVHLTHARISRLSPYLHFGQISPVEVAIAVETASAPAADRSKFLEELVVRRELAANFVNANSDYARYCGLPRWARQTLALHVRDPRDKVYEYSQLADAKTHDPYWNAAMAEMRWTGFLHNHLRMYWGKKVLEWSATPQEAYAALLRLNNTYFLDGRDASSFANVGWVFGLHDRPWPERAIFGNVRYMNAAGLRRKTDIEAFLSATTSSQRRLFDA
jgi:deoxyribodipyrimidine photo-lyase